jgi:PAS domain S-box-containing protein
MCLAFIFTADYEGTFSIFVVAGLTFCYFLLLMMRYKNMAFFNKGINSFTCVCEVTLFWVSLSVLTHILFDDGDSDIGLIYMVILVPFAAYSFLFMIERTKFSTIKKNVKNLKKDEEVEIYFNIVRELIEMREKDSYRIKLEGMLKYYSKNCTRPENEKLCNELSYNIGKEDDGGTKISKWYYLLQCILLDSIEKFAKSPRLHLLNAYLQHEKLNNRFQAYFELVETKENKPSLQEEFAVFRHKLIIEEEMIEAEMRNADTTGMNVNQMVDFQNKFVLFVNKIESAVNLHGDFWRELTEENPDTKKLQNLGSKITNIIEETQKDFDKLNEINSTHTKCLEIYGYFLKDVVNDENNGQRILDRCQKLNKSFTKTVEDFQKFDENSNTCIITVSGNFKTMGTIINVNNEIYKLLGYNKNEVIGEKVESLMPKIFSDNHQRLLMRFFNNPSDRPLNIVRTVYAMNKKGYILPCSLTAKILPNLDKGIQIVGFLKPLEIENDQIEQDNFLLYSDEDGMVYGVTKGCYENFGIRASLTYGKCYNMSELKLDQICPKLLDPKNMDDLKSNNGMVLDIDTSPIQANHPLENENDESVDDLNVIDDEHQEVMEQIEKLKRYKKYRIRVRIFSSDTWFEGQLKVNVLKFAEVHRDDKLSLNQSLSNEEKSGMLEDGEEEVDEVQPFEQSMNEVASEAMSSAASIENNKELKEAKALISEKNVPKSIKLLNRIFIILKVALLVIYQVGFFFFLDKNDNMTQSLTAAIIIYSRHSMLAETNYYSRKLNLAAK